MTKLIKWLDATSVWKFFCVYLLVSAIVLILGILLFFPLLLVYSMLGMEFSNLGPIATFFWGILFEVFVVTPVFLMLLIIKIVRRYRERLNA